MVYEAINIEPTIVGVFSFFEIEGVKNGGWVTLSGLPSKSFLQAYTTNYKLFKDWFIRIRCRPRCPQVIYALDKSYHFPIYWIGNPLSISKLNFNKLNNHEVRSLAILDSFGVIKVWDLLSIPKEEIISLLGNDYLFTLRTTWDTVLYSANFFSYFAFRKNDWHLCERAEKTDARSPGGKESSRPKCC